MVVELTIQIIVTSSTNPPPTHKPKEKKHTHTTTFQRCQMPVGLRVKRDPARCNAGLYVCSLYHINVPAGPAGGGKVTVLARCASVAARPVCHPLHLPQNPLGLMSRAWPTAVFDGWMMDSRETCHETVAGSTLGRTVQSGSEIFSVLGLFIFGAYNSGTAPPPPPPPDFAPTSRVLFVL